MARSHVSISNVEEHEAQAHAAPDHRVAPFAKDYNGAKPTFASFTKNHRFSNPD
jgi:hypothetical protein